MEPLGGISKFCHQKLNAPVLELTDDVSKSSSAEWLQKSHHFCLEALLMLNTLKDCLVFCFLFFFLINISF